MFSFFCLDFCLIKYHWLLFRLECFRVLCGLNLRGRKKAWRTFHIHMKLDNFGSLVELWGGIQLWIVNSILFWLKCWSQVYFVGYLCLSHKTKVKNWSLCIFTNAMFQDLTDIPLRMVELPARPHLSNCLFKYVLRRQIRYLEWGHQIRACRVVFKKGIFWNQHAHYRHISTIQFWISIAISSIFVVFFFIFTLIFISHELGTSCILLVLVEFRIDVRSFWSYFTSILHVVFCYILQSQILLSKMSTPCQRNDASSAFI